MKKVFCIFMFVCVGFVGFANIVNADEIPQDTQGGDNAIEDSSDLQDLKDDLKESTQDSLENAKIEADKKTYDPDSQTMMMWIC